MSNTVKEVLDYLLDRKDKHEIRLQAIVAVLINKGIVTHEEWEKIFNGKKEVFNLSRGYTKDGEES